MDDSYIIYTQAGFKCLFCEKSTELLNAKGKRFALRPLERVELLEIAEEANMTTVPIIYHDGVLIGGFTELSEFLKETA